VTDSTEEIVYNEAVRATTEQEDSLDDLRSRTGTLLAAASLITAFLGSQALARHPIISVVRGQRVVQADLDFLAWSAIAAFVAVSVFTIVILLPWTWGFILSPKVLFEDHVDVPERNSAAQLHRFLAETLEAQWDQNQKKLNRLFWCFRLACFSLSGEVILWLVVLGGK